MKTTVRSLRPVLAIAAAVIMVLSGLGSAAGPAQPEGGDTAPLVDNWDLDAKMGTHGTAPFLASGASSRQTLEDDFEVVSPYPTNEDIRDIAWRPGSSEALLVGMNGLVIEFDGVYFNVVGWDGDTDLYAVAWHPLGDYALMAGGRGEAFVYEYGEISELSTGTSGNFFSIDFSPDGDLALLMTTDGDILKYHDDTGAFNEVPNSITTITWMDLSWHPDGDTALLVGYEVIENEYGWIFQGRAFEYIRSTDQIRNLRPDVPADRDSDFYSVDWNDAGTLALIGGWNGLVWSYDGDVFGTVSYGTTWAPLYATEFGSGSEALLVGGIGTVFHYDSGFIEQMATSNTDWFFGVDFSNNGNIAYIVGDGGSVVAFDAIEGDLERISTGTTTTFFDVAWKPDWSYALLVGNQGNIYTFDGETLTRVSSPTTSNLLGVAWSPAGNRALIVGDGGTLLEFYHAGLGDISVTQRLSGTTRTLWDVAYNTNGQALIVGNNGEVRLWSGTFANKITSRTTRNLRAVDWKDSSSAYIVGDNGEVLRFRSTPTNHIDIASPSSITISRPLWSVDREDDKQSGYIVGGGGMMLEHFENNDASTLDDSYEVITTDIIYDLLDMDWNYDEDNAIVVGDFGTVFDFRESNHNIRTLSPPTQERLNGVDWKGNQYALIVGGGGTVMKYWPNLKPDAVTLSKPTEITDNSMKVSWTQSTAYDFHHYEVHMSTSSGFTMTPYTRKASITDVKKTTYTAKDLFRDTTYYFKVRVVDKGGLSADSNEVYGHTLVGQVPPVAVTLYDPEDITSSAMMLKWSRNRDTDFDHYELHMSQTEGFTPSGGTVKATIEDQYETEYSVQGLAADTTHYFKVRVVDEDGLLNDSNEVSGTTEDINYPPTAVELYEPFNITDDTLDLNWSNNTDSDFARYEVHLSLEEDFAPGNSTRVATITVRNETSYHFDDLEPAMTYYFKVVVYDTGDLSAESNEVSATTLEYNPPPEPVQLYEPSNVTEVTVSINWSRSNESDFERYEVHISDVSGFTPNASTLEDTVSIQNMTSYVITDLSPGRTYVIKVRVVDSLEQTADSNEVVVTTLGNAPPEAVVLEVTGVGETTVDLKWTRNNDTDFARYEVHYSTEDNFTVDLNTLFDDVNNQGTRASKVTGLELNTTYYFKVRVVDEFNLYADSNQVSATTLGPDMPPKAVVLGEPQNISRSSMELFWSQNMDQDFSYYEVHKSQIQGFTPSDTTKVQKLTEKTTTELNVTGLKMESTYYFIVRVFDVAGFYNDSNEVFAKTLPPNEKPIADAGTDMRVYTTEKVTLKGIGIDPDGFIDLYEWDFETDGTYDYSSGFSGEAETYYPAAGLYTAKFRVTDNEGATASDIINITVENEPLPNRAPRADAGPDQTVEEEETVYFEGTATDEDGYVTFYEWDFDGDGDFEFSSADDGSAEYIYNTEGIYKARLRVTDDLEATHVDVAIITVEPKNTPPVARIDKPLDGRKYLTEDFIQFDGSRSYDDDGDTLTYEWKDGDTLLSTKKKFSMQLRAARHTITLTVSDGDDTGEDDVVITVEEPENVEPSITITDPKKNDRVKGYIMISGKASDEDGTIEKVCVKIDSGSCLKAEGTRNWYFEWDSSKTTKGSHTILAIATDDAGDEAEAKITVTVEKDKEPEKGFFESMPGFEAPLVLAGAAVVALALASRRRRR